MTLIFDIGKTNKKALVFDADYQVVAEEQTVFAEVADSDGEPTDDIPKIEAWMLTILRGFEKLEISHINIATYGATLAHLDTNGKLLALPFNYLKKIDPSVKSDFLNENGGANTFCTATASPDLDSLLNSGFQLYWLKKTKPDFFKRIKTTLHLPQYLSYVLTGKLASEFTSIGCHTMLWDFEKKDYADWVKRGGFDALLPPVRSIDTQYAIKNSLDSKLKTQNRKLAIGIGLHDSSAALLPYLIRETKPFLLLSTGTWSICLNPFNTAPLSTEEFAQDCLFYMRPDGQPVKAARLFLGKTHDEAVVFLTSKFQQQAAAIRLINFDAEIFGKILEGEPSAQSAENLSEAYHYLMFDLIQQQVAKIKLAAGKTVFEKILIDGGFTKNPIYLAMLRQALPTVKIEPSDMPQGTALGAAVAANLFADVTATSVATKPKYCN